MDDAPRNELQSGVTGSDDVVLDPALVAQLREMAAAGRGDFVSRVAALYCEHAPKALVDIVAAYAADDAQAMASAAHALKSMSLNAGAKRVAALAGAIEKRGREAGSTVHRAEIAQLEAAIAEASAELGQMAQAA